MPCVEAGKMRRESVDGSWESAENDLELGPQYAKDSPFAARMRLHQSWYRARILGVPCGTGPNRNSSAFYGNMLTQEDGARGLNFLSPVIFDIARRSVAKGKGAIEPFRLFHNMLSSQPMCFNLFAPLVDNLDLATRLWRLVLPNEVNRVLGVLIEYAPQPPGEYLDDKTAFDAYVEYERLDGKLAFVGIETKLTEPFGRSHYDGPSYRRWMHGPGSPWRQDARDKVADKSHNQLWRDHLLAWAMLNHRCRPYERGLLMLVRHPDDGDCAAIVRGYRKLLRQDDDTFIDMPLDKLIGIWQRAPLAGEWRQWLARFEFRYLDLDASEEASQ